MPPTTTQKGKSATHRSCGTCTLCCKVLAVGEISKPAGVWCSHCSQGEGCGIHDVRPSECRLFNCRFLEDMSLREEWRPSKSRIVIKVSLDGQRVGAYVDPERPGAWRREPFYSTFKSWARKLASQPDRVGQMYVTIGRQTIVILPDRNVDVGFVEDDEIVITKKAGSGDHVTIEAFKIKRDQGALLLKDQTFDSHKVFALAMQDGLRGVTVKR